MKENFRSKCFGISVALVSVPTIDLWARAGGGGGGGGHGGGILTLILAPFFIIYAWYVNRRINKKQRLTELLLDKISKTDEIWKTEKMTKVVRLSFFKIQQAWCDLDLKTLEKLLH